MYSQPCVPTYICSRSPIYLCVFTAYGGRSISFAAAPKYNNGPCFFICSLDHIFNIISDHISSHPVLLHKIIYYLLYRQLLLVQNKLFSFFFFLSVMCISQLTDIRHRGISCRPESSSEYALSASAIALHKI